MTRPGPADPMPETENPLLVCSPYLALTGEPSIWEAARKSGVSAVELLIEPGLTCPDLITNPELSSRAASEDGARKMGMEAAESGVRIELFVAPLLLAAGMTSPPEWTEKLLGNARFAGARQVSFPLVTADFMAPDISNQDYIDSALHVFSSLVRTGEKEGVQILFENLSVYLNRPEILNRILDEFSREDLGFCLDPVNLCWYGHPEYVVYNMSETLASRATGLHIKNIHYPDDTFKTQRQPGWRYDELVVPPEQGDLDFPRLIRWFKASGFTGYYGIEDDSLNLVPKGRRLDILSSSVKFIQGLLE